MKSRRRLLASLQKKSARIILTCIIIISPECTIPRPTPAVVVAAPREEEEEESCIITGTIRRRRTLPVADPRRRWVDTLKVLPRVDTPLPRRLSRNRVPRRRRLPQR